MKDTCQAIAKLVKERHRAMTPTDRWLAASSMFDTARAIIESSLPNDLSVEDRRFAIARRLYNDELPEAALRAHAMYLAKPR